MNFGNKKNILKQNTNSQQKSVFTRRKTQREREKKTFEGMFHLLYINFYGD